MEEADVQMSTSGARRLYHSADRMRNEDPARRQIGKKYFQTIATLARPPKNQCLCSFPKQLSPYIHFPPI